MSIQLTIIGLGQIGASIGLALTEHRDKVTRVGSDIDAKVMQQAQKINAVDKTAANLNIVIKNADIVILAVPQDQIRKIMKAIAPALKNSVVLMDTAPSKAVVAKWAAEMLPEGCSYVGLTPVLNPRYLHSEVFGISAAHADLFHDGMFGIVTPYHTNTQALNLATDLIQLLGADPLFVDLYEIDGLMAATHLMPQLVSIAMLNATLDQPGWKEARKIAGRAFAEVSGPAAHLDEVEALVDSADLNKENVLRKLDDIIAALQGLRGDIAQGDSENLTTRLKHAKAGVNLWWKERGGGNWLKEEMPMSETLPTRSNVMGNLFGFGLGSKKKKNQ
jgi:prephenate dehydrogenase